MKNRKSILAFSILFLIVPSCDWIFRPGPCDASGPIIVYKTRQDYSNNITVQLSEDNKRITCTPGPGDAAHQRPIQLANGYLLKRMCGDAVLSLTFDEFITSTKSYSNAELLSMVIDTNPYLEKYECCECIEKDTAKINDLIRNNLLGRCKNIK
jgi:hypothetical protein